MNKEIYKFVVLNQNIMSKFKYLLLALIAFVAASCVNFNNPDKLPEFSEFKIENVKANSPTDYVVTVGATVENPVNKKFASNDFYAMVYRKGKKFAEAELVEPINIQQLYMGRVYGKFKVKLLDAKQAIIMGLTYKNINPQDFMADIRTQLKAGGTKKKLKFSVSGEQVVNIIKSRQAQKSAN